ncbi:hypothetical protein JXA27_03200 [Aerococcaceae bacterium zg-B36]|uniref:hypothetical protein n=1 Tax=Aerococcaceae bacterium zg-252 TaxID=2796928 RepID=UPI001BD83D34|nr:hypothetical protein [Aerococcaceae bacterium zg-B36]
MNINEQIKALYAQHQEMPYINPNRDLESWLNEVKTSSNKLVPKRNMIRLEEGYLPGHIIILWRVQFGTYTNETTISKYFEYSYGIDAKKELDVLIQNGYVIELSAFDSLDFQTAGQLKAYLKDKNISGLTKLKKHELEELIRTHFTEEELSTYFTIRKYALTPAGETLLNNHSEVIDKHPKKKF